jgi:lipoyl(octanoyl) transferase
MSRSRDQWRLILGDGRGLAPLDAATNMAVDAALLASVRAGASPTLRFYRWSPACLSFGRNQPARGRYDRTSAAARGITFVRRPTGGQAVLHDDELTYAVIAPVTVVGRPREAYRRINEALVAGLRSLGVAAALVGSARSRDRPALGWDRACFGRPEAGEVVVGGRKLVGSAQRTEGRVILQHGSVLVAGSQAVAEELLVGAAASETAIETSLTAAAAPAGWTTLASELGTPPDAARLAAVLGCGFEAVLGISLAPSQQSAFEMETTGRLRGVFSSDEWTWRR